MEALIIFLHVVVALGIIIFVLLQRGKGADAGASFGGGASQTVFGAAGSGNFMSRITWILSITFFLTSLALAYVASEKAKENNSLGLNPAQLENSQKVLENSIENVDDAAAQTVEAVEESIPSVE